MERNGKFFISTVKEDDFISSVWDPYVYRHNGKTHTLSHFATVQKAGVKSVAPAYLPFDPIEYRDIPHGNYLSFALAPRGHHAPPNLPVVGESELLFGTMRAYLGNIFVTPLAEWTNQKSPICFQVKSEFVVISPHDKLPYFWLAYMRSKNFLENLPLGSGGTRPRLQPKALMQTPVTVPPLQARKDIHGQLSELAKNEWKNYLKIISALGSLIPAE